MKQVRNIIFDLGGVILNIDNRLTEKAFIALGALDFRKFFGHGLAASFFAEYEKGLISDARFLEDLKKMIRVEVADAEMVKAWDALLLDFPPERIQLLDSLRDQYRLFLLSNTNALHLDSLRKIFSRQFGGGTLEDHFERTYYSHLIGMRKPDADAYEWVLRENQLRAEETFFVDDARINADGARSLGMQVHFLAPGETIMELDWKELFRRDSSGTR
jgi:HAD superfamily hydrolase (TIGR01509 family)